MGQRAPILPLGTVVEPLGPLHHYEPRDGDLKAVFKIGNDEPLVPVDWILPPVREVTNTNP